MKFCSLSSGSSGNCEYIEHNDTKILVDAGLSGKKVESLLDSIDVDIKTIDAIFVTHEHLDHIKGVGVLARRHNLKVFANQQTFNRMLPKTKEINSENVFFFENDKSFKFKDIYVEPLSTFHDCVKGTGFTFTDDNNKKVSLLTDTGFVDLNIMEKISNSDLYFLETNHDEDMLLQGSYPWSLKQRILSNRGHLSNVSASNLLNQLVTRKKEIVMLAHLSQDNNLPSLAARTVRESLLNKNINEGTDYILEVAQREIASEIYTL